jgi:carboxyl-terminal processing protease
MKRSLRRAWLAAVVLLALLLGIAEGMLLDRQVMVAAAGPAGQNSPNFHLLSEAWDIIQSHYVDRPAIDAQQLTYGALSGMVNALGDTGHTVFLTPQMVKEDRMSLQGEFDGIGATVKMKNGYVVIAGLIDDSPALHAGLRPGEMILKVDGQDMTGLALDQVVSHVLGPAGTNVTLTLRNPDTDQTRDLTITRAHIVTPSVSWRMLPGSTVAHVRLSAFSEKAGADLQKALAEVQQAGASAIILDMRNNPGGLLGEAISVASQFLKDGNVLQEKDSSGKVVATAVQQDVPKTDLPVIELANAGTASAAEIVSGALQDARRATVLGEVTFGTGTVLNQFNLSDGSAMNVAVGEWLTPKGRVIWHHGIVPDITITLPSDVNPLTPSAEKEMTPAQLRASGDTQLLAALDRLTKATAERAPAYWMWAK